MRSLLLLPLLALSAATPAASQAILVPVRCHGDCPAPGRLPRALAADTVDVWLIIRRGHASTSVRHLFRNDTDGAIDGALFFPLPDDATVSTVTVYKNAHEITQYGEWSRDEESRRLFDGLLRDRPASGLRAYRGARILHVPVRDIPARGTMRVKLEYTQPLREADGRVHYSYPLSMGGDAPWIGELALRATVETEAGFRAFSSPSHDVAVQWGSEAVRCPPGHRCGYRGAESRRIRIVRMRAGPGARRRDFELVYTPTPPGSPDAVSGPRDPDRTLIDQ